MKRYKKNLKEQRGENVIKNGAKCRWVRIKVLEGGMAVSIITGSLNLEIPECVHPAGQKVLSSGRDKIKEKSQVKEKS